MKKFKLRHCSSDFVVAGAEGFGYVPRLIVLDP
jgi:hypothetical protein